jgi:hypothetical protein
MKPSRIILPAILIMLAASVFAQPDKQNPAKKPAIPDTQKTFDIMKGLKGIWQGPVKTDPVQQGIDGTTMQASLRVTSSGNALVHEMRQVDTPDDTSHYGDLTILYLDEDRLMLTHYCDAGNRPRMVGKTSPDGKKVEFDFLDVSGGSQYGYMRHAVFTIIDPDHHIEDWTYIAPGDKPVQAHFDLRRAK